MSFIRELTVPEVANREAAKKAKHAAEENQLD